MHNEYEILINYAPSGVPDSKTVAPRQNNRSRRCAKSPQSIFAMPFRRELSFCRTSRCSPCGKKIIIQILLHLQYGLRKNSYEREIDSLANDYLSLLYHRVAAYNWARDFASFNGAMFAPTFYPHPFVRTLFESVSFSFSFSLSCGKTENRRFFAVAELKEFCNFLLQWARLLIYFPLSRMLKDVCL